MRLKVMKLARLSLFYLAGYLLGGGIGLLVNPALALKLLFAQGSYGPVMPRLVGLLMLGLGLVITQIIRLRVEVLYSTAIIVRLVLMAGLAVLYVGFGDPLFAVLIAVVGLGVILTAIGYTLDLRAGARPMMVARS